MGVGERPCGGPGALVPTHLRRMRVGARPMQQSRIHSALAEALAARGYDTLTEVQSAVIDEQADGRDLIVSAKTGSGKTVAFGLAIAPTLMNGDRLPVARAPLALVIAPTRELAIQVSKELQWLYD